MHWGPGRNPQCFKHYTQILERRKEGRRERGRKEGRGKKTTYSWTALPLSFPKVPTLRAGKEMLTLSAINDRKGKTSQNKCWTTFYLDSKETTSDFFFFFPCSKVLLLRMKLTYQFLLQWEKWTGQETHWNMQLWQEEQEKCISEYTSAWIGLPLPWLSAVSSWSHYEVGQNKEGIKINPK